MLVHTTASAYVRWREDAGRDHGFVPTMGALHAGHLALVRAARAAHAVCSASIFVNPLQFGPAEDLARYPRPLERDLALLEGEGVDAVFVPPVEEMYPAGFATRVEIDGPLTERLEGAYRPGHFGGVATVVARLLNLARPRSAYFGQKDAQQVLVVSRLARDLAFGCEIVVVPTVREPDGLALSSRNVYLDASERAAAAALSRALAAAAARFSAGERDGEALRRAVRAVLDAEPLIRTDYVSVCSPADLRELERVEGGALVALACRVGATRLIDNVLLGEARLVPG